MSMADSEPHGQALGRRREDFGRLASPLRREIKVHCYRMLGSFYEAEDAVQETYLRAWRSFSSFEGGLFRAWLYRIATNACLNAIETRKRARRLLPDQHGPAATVIQMPEMPATEVAWLEPYPESDLEGIADEGPNPEARYTSHEAVQLAFVATIQQLPPRQRAVLLLRDVLGWASAEVATLLGGTTASVNSALQRARETLAKRYPNGRSSTTPRPDSAQQELLARYLNAWERHDLDGFVALLKEDATFTMPPWLQWYVGREAIRAFFGMAWQTCGGLRLVPTAANGQPAFAVYEHSAAERRWNAHSIHVLTLRDTVISTFTMFVPPTGPNLFPAFGLSLHLPETDRPPVDSGHHHP